MLRPLRLLPFVLALAPAACVQLHEHDPLALTDGAVTPGPDAARSDLGTPPPLDAGMDLAIPDTGMGADTSTPVPPDAMATECTPKELSCTPDNRSVRTCSEQGRWMVTMGCSSQTACSAGACVCPGNCAEEVLQTATSGPLDELAGGGSLLYLAVNGTQASIRRFDVTSKKETVFKSGGPELTFFAVDSDGMGNLLWCSDVRGASRTGQVGYGAMQIETGACTHVRRSGNSAYFLGDLLYRKTPDPGAPRETVSTEAMKTFEIAGDFLYFIADKDQMALLKRLPLADPTKVETVLSTPDASFIRLLPDASHVYLISDGQILRVPQTANARSEVFWQEMGPGAWALAHTDTHLYWTTTTASGSGPCAEAQVMRKAKSGGAATVLSRTPGYCGGQLIRVDNQLYTVVWGPPGTIPAKILRIRL